MRLVEPYGAPRPAKAVDTPQSELTSYRALILDPSKVIIPPGWKPIIPQPLVCFKPLPCFKPLLR